MPHYDWKSKINIYGLEKDTKFWLREIFTVENFFGCRWQNPSWNLHFLFFIRALHSLPSQSHNKTVFTYCLTETHSISIIRAQSIINKGKKNQFLFWNAFSWFLKEKYLQTLCYRELLLEGHWSIGRSNSLINYYQNEKTYRCFLGLCRRLQL